VPLLLEPLNRYETNLINELGGALAFLETLQTRNIKLLCDLFHMNIEEESLAGSISMAKAHVGHVHFADSNRRAVGYGHTEIGPVVEALREIGYAGYLSAEVFPLPDPESAARQTIRSFQQHTGTP
jgi:sugar phosphate isomerase/epimerase